MIKKKNQFYRASEGQKGLWLNQNLNPSSFADNILRVIKFDGNISAMNIEQTFDYLLKIHPSLRVIFKMDKESLNQHVLANPNYLIRVNALEWTESKIKIFAQNAQKKPFNLETEIPFRTFLLEQEDAIIVVLVIHHIAIDLWSEIILSEQFFKILPQVVAGKSVKLLENSGSFESFLERQTKNLSQERVSELVNFWKQFYWEKNDPLTLPFSKKRFGIQSYEGRELNFDLKPEVYQSIKVFCSNLKISVYSFLITVFQIVYYRFSGEKKITIGSTTSGRKHAFFRKTVGYFVNPVPIRLALEGKLNLQDLFKKNYITIQKFLKHSELPFPILVDKLNIKKEPSFHPVFQVMFNYVGKMPFWQKEREVSVSENNKVRLTPVKIENLLAQFELIVNASIEEKGLNLSWQYNTALFSEREIKVLIEEYKRLVAQILSNSNCPLYSLFLKRDNSRFNKPIQEPCSQKFASIYDWFQDTVALNPNKVAIKSVNQSISFREFSKEVDKVYFLLKAKGVKEGDVVATFLKLNLNTIASVFAISKLNAVYLPLDTTNPPKRLNNIISSCNAWVLKPANKELSFGSLCKTIELESKKAALLPTSESKSFIKPNTNKIAYLIFTSGSTGTPKGVMVPNSAILNYLDWAIKTYFISGINTVALFGSLAFDMSLTALFAPILAGKTLKILPNENIESNLKQLIQDQEIDLCKITPSHLEGLVEVVQESNRAPSIKSYIFGGENLKSGLVNKALSLFGTKLNIYNEYGPTEATVGCMIHQYSKKKGFKPSVSIGSAIQNTEIFVLSEDLQIQPLDVPGELYISGIGLAWGYLNQPIETANKFIPHPFNSGERIYKTGDLAVRRANGTIDYLGRIDSQIKIRGFRIEKSEIESTICQVDGVKEAIVIVFNQKLYAAIVATVQSRLKLVEQVKSKVLGVLPTYMLPEQYIVLDFAPLTASGKTDFNYIKGKLQELHSDRLIIPLEGPLEISLGKIWSEVLGVKISEISRDDNFFTLGGDSVKILQVVTRIRRIGYDCGYHLFFEYSTIQLLAQKLKPKQSVSSRNNCSNTLRLPELNSKPKREMAYPLTNIQKGILFHYKSHPAAQAYIEQLECSLNGKWDADLFQRVLIDLQERHQILDSKLSDLDSGETVIIMGLGLKILFVEYDLTDLEYSAQIDQIETYKQEDLKKGINLYSSAPLRVSVFKLSNFEVRLLWCTHHIILDGWSLGILLKDFFSLYSSNSKGSLTDLNSSRFEYKQFINWYLSSNKEKAQKFWKKYLNNASEPAFVLGKNYEVSAYKYAEISTGIKKSDLRGVIKILGSNQITLNIYLQTVWAALLAKWNLQKEVIFGLVSNFRPIDLDAIERAVGMFVNTLPIKICFNNYETLLSTTNKVQQDFLKVRLSNYLSLNEIFDSSSLSTSLVNHLVIFGNFPKLDLEKENENGIFTLTDFRTREQTNYDFNLYINLNEEKVNSNSSLELKFTFNSNLYTEEEVYEIASVYKKIISDPRSLDKRFGELKLYSPPSSLLNKSNHCSDREGLILTVEKRAHINPDHQSIMYQNQNYTLKELNEISGKLAQELVEKGVQKGDIIALMIPRSIESICAILAVLKVGCTYLPISPDSPMNRINQILQSSQCKFLITKKSTSLIEDISQVVIDVKSLTPSEKSFSAVPVSLNSLLYILFTSGSTGNPKGVMIEQRSVVHLLKYLEEKYTLEKGDAFLLKTPYTFDISCPELFCWIYGYGKLVISEENDEKDPEKIADLIIKHKITHINFVPSMLHIFLDVISVKKLEKVFDCLKYVFSCGELLRLETIKKFYSLTQDVQLINLYGPTESTVYATEEICASTSSTYASIGRPLAGISANVLDNDLNTVSAGVVGNLYLEGVGLSRGYLNNPRLTAENFVPSIASPGKLMYHTGDKVTYTRDGKLLFKGRSDTQVKIRGYRIEIQDVEENLAKLKMINTCAVKTFEENGVLELVAFYVLSEACEVSKIKDSLSALLPPYMIPSLFIEMSSIPLTSNGKIDYKQLKKTEYINKGLTEHPNHIDDNIYPKKLLSLWEETLGLSVGSYHSKQSFFDLGGHSLTLMTLLNKIRTQFQSEISIQSFFNSPYLAFLNEQITCKSTYKAKFPQLNVIHKNEFPLTNSQRKIFAHQNLFPTSTAYNLPGAFIFEGKVEFERLQNAFFDLQMRHQALRIKIKKTSDSGFYQKIEKKPLTKITVNKLSEKSYQGLVSSLTQPFNLLDSPLLKCSITQLDKENTLLFIDIHHIIADGISLETMLKEFAILYKGQDLNKSKVEYCSFLAHYEEESRVKPKETKHFWRDYLTPNLPILDFPNDFSESSKRSYQGRRISLEWSSDFSNRLEQFAKQRKITLNALLLSASTILLHRYTSQESILIGFPSSSRDLFPDAENVVGMLVNTLYLKTDITPTVKVDDILESIRKDLIALLEHKHEPIEAIISQSSKDLSMNPVKFFMAYQEIDFNSFKPTGTQVRRVKFNPKEIKFDLNLEIFRLPNGFELNLDYASELISESSAQLFLRCLEVTLLELVKNTSNLVNKLKILPDDINQKITIDFNKNKVPYRKELDLFTILTHKVKRNFCKTIIGDPEANLTGEDFKRKIQKITSHLAVKGVQRGQVVAVCCPRSIEMLATIYAIFNLGATYLPISPSFPVERQKLLIQQSGASLVCHTESFILLEKDFGCKLLNINHLDDIKALNIPIKPSPNSLAYVLYTSGTTGLPKGVQISHKSVINRLEWMQSAYPLNDNDVILQKTPSTFDVSVWELFLWTFSGAKLFLLEEGQEKNPHAILEAINKHSITVLHFVPSMLGAFLDFLSVQPDNNKISLKKVFVSGESLPKEIVIKFHQIFKETDLINLYGPTEATVDVTHFPCRPGTKKVFIGRPIQNHQIFILDPYLNVQPIGVPGKLFISGTGLTPGYLNKPSLTAEKFIPNPFITGQRMYDSGDIARFNYEGEIEFLGRADRQIKIRGMRVELGEIENALLKIPFVKQAAVLYLKVENFLANQLIAYVSTSEADCEERIISKVKKELPDYLIPKKVIILDAIPATKNGKLDYNLLQSKYTKFESKDSKSEAEQSESQQNNPILSEITQIWQKVLKIEKIYPNDNFYELGGDSILAIQIVAQAQGKGLYLTVQDIMQKQSIQKLTDCISTKIGSLLPGDKEVGSFLLSPIQEWFFSFAKQDLSHFNQSILLTSKRALDSNTLTKTLELLIESHDMLKARFYCDGKVWSQEYSEVGTYIIDFHDLKEMNQDCKNMKICQIKEKAQKSLSIEEGRLLSVQHLKLSSQKEQLLFICHHLIIDGVSWRFFLEDFCNIYMQISSHQKTFLPQRSNSYASYVKEVQALKSKDFLLGYWEKIYSLRHSLPVDIEHDLSIITSLAKTRVSISEEDTYKLYTCSKIQYKCQIEELLLKGFLDAVFQKWDLDSIVVNLENHGRSNHRLTKNYSRTLGWFTTLYPVLLQGDYTKSRSENIYSIQQSVQEAKKNALDFAVSKYIHQNVSLRSSLVCFNFHGNLDHAIGDLALFKKEYSSETGTLSSEKVIPPHLISLNLFVLSSQLHIECEYSQTHYLKKTIDNFLSLIKQKLSELSKVNLLSESLNKTNKTLSRSNLEKVFSQLR